MSNYLDMKKVKLWSMITQPATTTLVANVMYNGWTTADDKIIAHGFGQTGQLCIYFPYLVFKQ